MIIQAALVAVVAFLASVDEQLFGASMMARPLFTGMLVGAIMGDNPPLHVGDGIRLRAPSSWGSWNRTPCT